MLYIMGALAYEWRRRAWTRSDGRGVAFSVAPRLE
jgi:hypothetical protein